MKATLLAFAVFVLSNFNGFRATEVCCSGQGCCFSNDAPYNGLPLPQCPGQYGLSLSFRFYTRGNQVNGEEFSRTVFPTYFNSTWRLTFIVHGWGQDQSAQWMHDVKDRILTKANYNMVIVGWSCGSQNANLNQSISDTRTVGAEIALLAQNALDRGLSRIGLYCIGHDLGGQVCSAAGNRLKFARISALDPFAPIFEDRGIGLNTSNADFVDVIHASNKVYANQFRLGIKKAIGHVDFYPNGGQTQPGCDANDVTTTSTDPNYAIPQILSQAGPRCNHYRAFEFYNESILTNCFVARNACTNENSLPDSCSPLDVKFQYMGLSSYSFSPRGIFYQTTNGQPPFCQG